MNTPEHRPGLDADEQRLSARLRELPGEPSPELDARVLAGARRAVAGARPPRRAWVWGVGTAAAAVLALGTIWRMGLPPASDEELLDALPPPPAAEPAVDAAAAPAADGLGARPRPQAEAPPAELGAAAGPAREQRAEAFVEDAEVPRQLRLAPPPPPAPAAPPASRSDRTTASGTPPEAAASAAAREQQARQPIAEFRRRADDPAEQASEAPAAEGAERAAKANEEADMAEEAPAPLMVPAPEREPMRIESPEAWIKRIETLLDEGHVEEARRELQRLVATHRGVELPDRLKALGDPRE